MMTTTSTTSMSLTSRAIAQRVSFQAKPVAVARRRTSTTRTMPVVTARAMTGYAHTQRKGLTSFVERAERVQMKRDLIPFRVGMTVKVGVTVIEGDKKRVQPYEGVVIGIHRQGLSTSVTVRKSAAGFGVERCFPVHSPLCTFEEVRGAGKPVVRRAKLFYLRDLVGKQGKLKTRFVSKKEGMTRHELRMQAMRAEDAAKAAAAPAAEKSA